MSKALELAAWMNEGAWHQITLGHVEAVGAELRRLADIEHEHRALLVNEQNLMEELAALKASLGEPVAWQKKRLLRHDDNWTKVDFKNVQPYRDSPDFAVRPLYALTNKDQS